MSKVPAETEARIRALAEEMKAIIPREPSSVSDDHGDWTPEGPAASLMRAICWELLDAAQASGLGGCPLCQG